MFKFLRKKDPAPFEYRSMSVGSTFWNIFSGTKVQNHISIGTVYACIRMISDSVAMTPLKVYEKGKDGRDELDNNPVSKVLRNPQPNKTFYQWANAMAGQFTGWGNAYSYIERDTNSDPLSLIYIPTSNVTVRETKINSEPYYYEVTLGDGSKLNVFPEDMIHWRNITLDGFTGLSPIGVHASTFDRGYYESEFVKQFMINGGNMSGIITSEKKLKTDQVEQLKKDFSNAYGGAENAGKIPVLSDGLKYDQLKPISPLDADYVNSKKLTKSEIMEIFKVPPPLLGVIDATYNNTEQLALIYQRYTLSPIYTMIEQEMTLKLVSSIKQGKIYLEFMSDALLNATAKDKAEVITKLTEKGIMTLNEGRRKYNLKDLDGLNQVVLPLNSAPLELHEKVLTPAPAPDLPAPAVEDPAPVTDENQNRGVTQDQEQITKMLHKMQSDIGRIKKQLGNSTP